MKSYFELLTDIREKIISAREQLFCEKKALYKLDEMFSSEKEKWAKEIKAEKIKIHLNEKLIKEKEEKLKSMKADYDIKLDKLSDIESQNEELKREIQKVNAHHNGNELQVAKLGEMLLKLQERYGDLVLANGWSNSIRDKNLKIQDTDNECNLKNETQELSYKFSEEIKTFDESLKDIEEFSLKPRQQKLKEMQAYLVQLKGQCEEIEKRNKCLEAEIALLKTPSTS